MSDVEEEVIATMAADPTYPLGETDAMKWAIAFRQVATMDNPLGRALRAFPDGEAQLNLVDIMIGWFANAMASADPKTVMVRTSKRLYVGSGVSVVTAGLVIQNHIETFVGWFNSADEARGDWVSRIFAKHPSGRLDSITVDDMTEYARNPS